MTSAAAIDQPEHGFFAARDGQQLYHEVWPAQGETRARVVVVHGYGEHCGRYQNLVRALQPRGLEIFAFDYRGHGQAGGRRGHVDHFAEYLDDVDRALEVARQRAPRPTFLLGHSLGGLITARHVIERSPELKGAVLSSPFLGLRAHVPAVKQAVGRLASRWAPRLSMSSGLDSKLLSRDPAVGEAYDRDRFVHHVATSRWFTEALAAQRRALEEAATITLPLLVFAGDADGIADTDATRTVFARVGSKDKTLKVYPGGYHELMNDTCKDEVLATLADWLERHI